MSKKRIIDLDALIGDAAPITLWGQQFEGRELNLLEREAWIEAEATGDSKRQRELIAEFLNDRGGDGVTPERVGTCTASQLVTLVRTLFNVGDEGNVAKPARK